MDFYEAAVEVLRHAGRPLHYKKIIEIAVDRGLLAPTQRSEGRGLRQKLDAIVEAGGNSALIGTRPGVFALSGGAQLAATEAPRSKPERAKTPSKRRSDDARLASPRALRSSPTALQSIAMRARGVLKGHQRQPMTAHQLAEVVMDDVAKGDARSEALLRAALTAANRAQQSAGHRPLFEATADGAWGLVEWGLTDAAVEREAELMRIAQDISVQTEEKLTRSLQMLSREGVEHLVFRLLESLGAGELMTVRQEDGTALVTAIRKDVLSTTQTTILILGSERTADLDDFDALQDALGDDPAGSGLLVAPMGLDEDTGPALSEDPRLRHHDASSLASLLVRHRIGVQTYSVPVVLADATLLRDLGQRS